MASASSSVLNLQKIHSFQLSRITARPLLQQVRKHSATNRAIIIIIIIIV